MTLRRRFQIDVGNLQRKNLSRSAPLIQHEPAQIVERWKTLGVFEVQHLLPGVNKWIRTASLSLGISTPRNGFSRAQL